MSKISDILDMSTKIYKRAILHSSRRSFFLFGARATGKSTFLKEEFGSKYPKDRVLWIDLLNPELEKRYLLNPEILFEELKALKKSPEFVIIDEIQKVPKLLDVVHLEIEKNKRKFVLTGSSARKLKRGASNLLAGRAYVFEVFPLTAFELGNDFIIEDALSWGTLPTLYELESPLDKMRYLKAYAQTYLKEEIQTEQIVRQMEPFRFFLEVAAQSNGQILNYSRIAQEAGIDTKSVQRYFEILEDTFVGTLLPAHGTSIRKQQTKKPKFYFFDTGVARALSEQLDIPLKKGTYAFGNAFEHFVVLEVIRYNKYFEKGFKTTYLRTKDGVEIDLILQKGKQHILIEIKSKDNVIDADLSSLRQLGKEFSSSKSYLLCLSKTARIKDGIKICHWYEGLKEIFKM